MSKILKISCITALLVAIMLAMVLCELHTGDKANSATTYSYSSAEFSINSQEDFDSFFNTFGGTTNYFSGKTVNLNCDVDMTGKTILFKNFYGTFNGNNHIISNATDAIFGGLIGADGVVRNLTVNNINSSSEYSAICESNSGILDNIKVTGSLNYLSLGGLVYSNYGTITNCYNYATLNISGSVNSAGAGGIAFSNFNIITNSHFLGNIIANNTVSALGAIVALNYSYVSGGNTVYGLVEECSATAEITITTTGYSEYDSTLPSNCGALIGSNNGQVINSYFIGYYDGYLTLPVAAIGDDSGNTCALPYTNVYMMTQSLNTVYDTATDNFITPPVMISDYIDFDAPNDTVFASNLNSYPVLKLLDGSGTPADPFLIKDVYDLYNLRGLYNTAGIGYVVFFADDVDCRNFSISIDLNGFTYLSNIDGQGFALHNYSGSALFVDDQAATLYNLGFYNCPSITISDTLFDKTSNYTYGYGASNFNITKTLPASGSGTEIDPYIITTKEELAYIDGSSAYFELGNSIVVNSDYADYAYYLNITSFGGNLNGNGYYIIGLFEPLTAVNTGTIANVNIKGYTQSSDSCLVALTNSGTISNLNIYSSIGTASTAFASVAVTNNGTISEILCYGNDVTATATVAGIAINNNSLIENCFVDMATDNMFATVNTGTVNTSIGYISGGYSAYDNNTSVAMEYFALVNSGFDVTNVFGYQYYTSNAYPTMRENGVRYKIEADLYDKTNTFVYTYSASASYEKTSIISEIVESTNGMTITWKYNGSDYSAPTVLQDAGIYTVTFVYSGSLKYLPSTYTQTITINKKAVTTALTFETGSFNNISQDYSGELVTVGQPAPTNLLTNGYTYIYTLRQGTDVITEIRNAGTYTQTIVGTSTNYADVTAIRTIIVSKADLAIALSDMTINYLDAVDITTSAVTITDGLLDYDLALTLNELILSGTTPVYTTDYVTGANVGEYYINYSATLTNYNITSVEQGTLTVNKLDLEQGGIVFSDTTVNYIGNNIAITASNLPDGASVAYDSNTYLNAGAYLVTATFSKANYNDLVLTATLTINKINLTFEANDVNLPYLAGRTALEQNTFSYTATGLAGGDITNLSTVVSSLIFNYKVTKEGAEVSIFDVGSYDIELEISGTLDNYNINISFGTLIVYAVNMTSLYANHSNYSATYNGEIVVHPITFFDEYEVEVDYTYYLNSVQIDNATDAGTYSVVAVVPKINGNYLDTTYNYTITVNRADLAIYFANVSYTAVYSSENKATNVIYPYSGTLPDGLNAMFTIKQSGSAVAEAKNAGTYTIGYMVAQSTNYNSKVITATFTVTAKPVSVTIQSEYTYTSSNIVPVVNSITGVLNNEMTSSNISYLYYNSSNVLLDRITRVGSYTLIASVNNANYSLATTSYSITVSRLAVSVDLKYIEYSYGFTGNMTYDGIEYTVYSGGIIVRHDYLITPTQYTVDISYMILRDDAGTYTVTSINSVENYSFSISENSSLNNNNKVKINKVGLYPIWKFGSTDVSGVSKTLQYAGVNQLQYFGYTMVGFVNNHTQSDFSFILSVRNDKTLYDVGSYELYITLINESNYFINENTSLAVSITKTPLNVKMLDVTVFQGEVFGKRSYQILNPVGNDQNITDIYTVKGASLSVVCAYTTASQAGATFEYYFSGSFTNYELNITRKGVLTVVENTKINFTLTDATYAYDGNYKSLAVAQSAEVIAGANVDLVYSSNNYQKNVGTYSITLTVTYHVDNSIKVLTRSLAIIKSYPTVVMEEAQMVYRDNLTLTDDKIKGKAYLGTNEVAGTFRFTDSFTLQQGTKTDGYAVEFVPADTDNLLTRTAIYYIEGVVINANIFEYSDLTLISYTTTGIEITGTVTMTLKDGIIEGLSLYKDDIYVAVVEFNKSESTVITVKFDNEVVLTWDVVVNYIDTTQSELIVVDYTYLDLTNGLSLSNDTLTVAVTGGRLGLASKYADKYVMYINGYKVVSDYPINGDEKSLVIVIKEANTNAVVFAEEYKVVAGTAEEIEEPKDYTPWIIAGSVIGGVGLIIGIYFLIRKKRIS